MAKLKDIVDITKGRKHQEVEISIDANRYIQIADLSSDESPKYTVEKGVVVNKNDLIIAWDGANAGKVGYNLDGVIGSTLARLRILNGNVLPSYLFWFLDSQFENIKSKRTGATIPHVNGNELRNLLIPLPPLPTQRAIAERLDGADALRQKDRQLLREYDALAEAVFVEMFGDPVRNEKGWEVKELGLTCPEIGLHKK